MHDTKELQDVFREAATTLGKRVLEGRELVWKPSTFDALKTQLRATKTMVQMASDRAHGAAPPRPGIEGFGSDASPPPLARQGSLSRPPLPGQQRGRAMAVSQAPGVSATLPRHAPRLFKDVGTAASRMGAITDGVAWVEESLVGTGDLLLDPSALKVGSMAGGFQDPASPTIKACISGMADMLGDAGVFDQVFLDNGKEIAGEIATCLPVIGAVMTLSAGAANVVKLILDQRKVVKLNKNAQHFTLGLPAQALQEVAGLYNRSSVEEAARAATNLTAGGLAVAGLAVDMGGVSGPLMGIARSTINLLITIVNMTMTLREMRIGNEILRNKGPYDATLLTRCPILGAYILTEAESSTLYAFLHANKPLSSTWMSEVERLKPKIDTVVVIANALQRRSPFELSQVGAAGVSFAKGDHYMKPNARNLPARLAHEAGLAQRRDPAAVGFLVKHGDAVRPRR